jgi:release factor glutamine methyltransferase
VNTSVLIPRPETELLAQYAIDLANPQSILCDIGTGSGAIAISFSGETNLPALGCEISPMALRVAKQNAKHHKLDHLVSFLEGHLLQPLLTHLPAKDRHLILTANLPYLPARRKTAIDPDVYHFEPHVALFGGLDGLDLYHELFSQLADARPALPDRIHLLIEIDPIQARSAPVLLKALFPHAQIDVLDDLSKKPRILSAQI